jgi:hypothetical protein
VPSSVEEMTYLANLTVAIERLRAELASPDDEGEW